MEISVNILAEMIFLRSNKKTHTEMNPYALFFLLLLSEFISNRRREPDKALFRLSFYCTVHWQYSILHLKN